MCISFNHIPRETLQIYRPDIRVINQRRFFSYNWIAQTEFRFFVQRIVSSPIPLPSMLPPVTGTHRRRFLYSIVSIYLRGKYEARN